VQGLLSVQDKAAPPWQEPPEQTSFVVQLLPSLHGIELLVVTQPETGSHELSVQGLLSVQDKAAPPWQEPPEQTSPVVQALPSLHEAVLLVVTHPEAGLQELSVQGLLSVQDKAAPPWQEPPEQTSLVVHALPSSQEEELFEVTHPDEGLHELSVQGLLSVHSIAKLLQVPLLHLSAVQASPSSHVLLLFV